MGRKNWFKVKIIRQKGCHIFSKKIHIFLMKEKISEHSEAFHSLMISPKNQPLDPTQLGGVILNLVCMAGHV